ncbi:hypothetical protein EV207_14420 [Scopulibacillus darangshiensis]|uniref:TRAP transporter TAXI family solute receptor n=1 Tax=Scopulibacillus darangshiensis TaxID=442528 RepID=A0A4R2NJ93_9BACL|nr:TAXI family TRAP transporter solute-binding subunit [Scopulibacillus darangshiensis]TCP21295.1 hypothetical protein EV207_14420 [Scopulibacillus darangshiensis]
MKKVVICIIVSILMVVLTACSNPYATGKKTDMHKTSNGNSGLHVEKVTHLTWAAGSLGGGWYSMAGGIASIINKTNPKIIIKTIPGGSLQNIPFVENGTAQLAWEQPAFIKAAAQGEDPFKKKYPNIVAIGNGFGFNYFHFAVDANSKINSIDEIFKKKIPIKIAVTPVNNTDEWVLRKVLDYYGVTYKDIKSWGGNIFHGSYTEQAEQFKNGNVDAMFTQLAIPGSAITEASNGREMKILPMSNDLIKYLSKYGIEKGILPAGTYPKVVNGNKDIQTAMMGTILVTNKDVPDNVIYEITKIINDNQERLPSIQAALKDYDIKKAVKNLGTDLHPGAKMYYKEMGIIK